MMVSVLVFLLQIPFAAPAKASLAGDVISAEVIWETTPVSWPAGFNVLIPAGTTSTVNLSPVTPEYSVQFFSLGGSIFEIDFFDGPAIGGSTNALSIHVDFADLAVWPIPSTFRVTLSDLNWTDLSGPGQIDSIVKVSGEPGVLEVIGFTANSITLAMNSTVNVYGTGFDVEYRYTASSGPSVTVLGPYHVSNVFNTPPCFSQGSCTSADFPFDWGVIRTFDYSGAIPAGDRVVDIFIDGTWGGNFGFNGSAPVELFLEGIPIAECVLFAPCWDGASTVDWNGGAGILLSDLGVDFSNPAVRASFEDGFADLSAIQNDLTSVNLTNLSLLVHVTSAPPPVTQIDFDTDPQGVSVTAGTEVNFVYQSLGVIFDRVGPGTLCGPEVYANSNQPAGFGSPPNVVSVCNQGGASDISENLFGMVDARFAGDVSQVCVDVLPDGPTHAAVLRAFDGAGTQIGEVTSTLGVTEQLCFSGVGIRSVRFSGNGSLFARFDNFQAQFVPEPDVRAGLAAGLILLVVLSIRSTRGGEGQRRFGFR